MKIYLAFVVFLSTLCFGFRTPYSFASEPIIQTEWEFTGKIIEISSTGKIIKVETPVSKAKNKVVPLVVTPSTVLSREYVVKASELRVGDNLIGFGNSSYSLSFADNSFDRSMFATVINQKPVTLELRDWWRGTYLSDAPVEGDENNSNRATFGNFAIITMADSRLTFSAISAKNPAIFTLLDEKSASFHYYSPIQFLDFSVGQTVETVVSTRPKKQTERVTLRDKQ